jgi:ABC-type sugar transport system ATPase subunit
MFDEPTAGMSHDEAPVILNLIRELKKDKTKITWWSTRWMWCASWPTASSC